MGLLESLQGDRIYVDTNTWIYALEGAYLKVRGRVRQRSRNRGKEVIKAVIGPS